MLRLVKVNIHTKMQSVTVAGYQWLKCTFTQGLSLVMLAKYQWLEHTFRQRQIVMVAGGRSTHSHKNSISNDGWLLTVGASNYKRTIGKCGWFLMVYIHKRIVIVIVAWCQWLEKTFTQGRNQ